MAVPTYNKLFNPVLKALHQLGGSASVSEIEEKVAENLKLSENEINEIHRGSTTKIKYRLAWARNYMKRYGLLENSSRGIWALTAKGQKTKSVDENKVERELRQPGDEAMSAEEEIESGKELSTKKELWQEKLLTEIMKLSPQAFEKLCQRILRESGFIKVEITGRSGDGGIDGRGIVRMSGLLSFHVVFQCKRYAGSVTPSQIRDFRGASQGRGDKGLFITTGSFTRDAKAEANRDGAPPIDLIDGDQLVEMMKSLNLGVNIKLEEAVEIDKEWFSNF